MDLGLAGKSVQSVVIEYTLRMRLSDVYFIVIESPFTIHHAEQSISLSPEEDPDEAFQPVRELIGQTVQQANADVSGALHVHFSGGSRLEVQPDQAYEAWNVSGPDGALVVCTPGGKLAIWSASKDVNPAGNSGL